MLLFATITTGRLMTTPELPAPTSAPPGPPLPPGFIPVFLNEVNSTNTYALERIAELDHHSVIVSTIQTAGRGRRQRQWNSSVRGNLYMSLIEKDPPQGLRPEGFTQLMALAAVAACRRARAEADAGAVAGARTNADARVKIKWPNDIFIEQKKVGGILSESRFSNGACRNLVIGLGMNIVAAPRLPNNRLRNYPITALNDVLSVPLTRNNFLSMLLNEYACRYPLFLRRGYAGIAEEYEAELIPRFLYS
ncbi:MAG: biotin--[acetyl-CoA-carboxylase] ligase [Salinispira sp.]